MADATLQRYRRTVARKTRLSLPAFAPEARHTAPILAILETPGNSGAERSGCVSLKNDDPTAKRTARIIEEVGIERSEIVFWNLYAAYKARHRKRPDWASHLTDLINLMPNLKVVIAFGDHAWRGMRDVELPPSVYLIGAPHPSNRSCNLNDEAEPKITHAWQRAKLCLSRPRRRIHDVSTVAHRG